MKTFIAIIPISIVIILFILLLKDKHTNQIDYTVKVYQNKASLYDQETNKEVGTCTLDSIGTLIIKDNL